MGANQRSLQIKFVSPFLKQLRLANAVGLSRIQPGPLSPSDRVVQNNFTTSVNFHRDRAILPSFCDSFL